MDIKVWLRLWGLHRSAAKGGAGGDKLVRRNFLPSLDHKLLLFFPILNATSSRKPSRIDSLKKV